MNENHHMLNIIDFTSTAHHTIFVKVTGYDAVIAREFTGEVKFVGGRPYGDIIHPQRTHLSFECRQFVQELLLKNITKVPFSHCYKNLSALSVFAEK
ncbi:hypothetical protein [Cytobacillus horneckiae]|uniref:hypothetical protein n=1 Tax=Cytobacillus horneckiae TaxID=549687 RepID=UPI003D256737